MPFGEAVVPSPGRRRPVAINWLPSTLPPAETWAPAVTVPETFSETTFREPSPEPAGGLGSSAVCSAEIASGISPCIWLVMLSTPLGKTELGNAGLLAGMTGPGIRWDMSFRRCRCGSFLFAHAKPGLDFGAHGGFLSRSPVLCHTRQGILSVAPVRDRVAATPLARFARAFSG